MNEEEKKHAAVFRYGVIHEFVSGAELSYGEQERLLTEKSSRKVLFYDVFCRTPL